ncbi:8921_t:CDS:1 [Scutellospora calospora]|uniref:8921_t:CDS:1 n=1 Tax=Scutellospora calospora TaxID=85575 RepID=A0ACA9L464_9GLOM|nr:8921_t:CDS:1 [Scutellospora calospora]
MTNYAKLTNLLAVRTETKSLRVGAFTRQSRSITCYRYGEKSHITQEYLSERDKNSNTRKMGTTQPTRIQIQRNKEVHYYNITEERNEIYNIAERHYPYTKK